MLKKKKSRAWEWLKTIIFVLFWFGSIVLIVGTSPLFKSCTDEQYHQAAGKTLYENPSQVLILVEVWIGCSGEFIHKYADAIIAVFTVILGVATWLLWRATKALVVGAEDTSARQSRAYVFVDQSEIRQFGWDQPPEAWLLLKNMGTTPAYQVRRRAHIGLSRYPCTSFETPAWPAQIAKSDLGPGGEIQFGPIALDRKLTNEETDKVVKGEYAIYVWGEVKYLDAFGEGQEMEFRYYFRGNGTPQYNTVPTTHDFEGNNST